MQRKQSAEGPKERRPFSREEDLNVNKFDDAQRETIMKKARQLNDRFSAGKAKFLWAKWEELVHCERGGWFDWGELKR